MYRYSLFFYIKCTWSLLIRVITRTMIKNTMLWNLDMPTSAEQRENEAWGNLDIPVKMRSEGQYVTPPCQKQSQIYLFDAKYTRKFWLWIKHSDNLYDRWPAFFRRVKCPMGRVSIRIKCPTMWSRTGVKCPGVARGGDDRAWNWLIHKGG